MVKYKQRIEIPTKSGNKLIITAEAEPIDHSELAKLVNIIHAEFAPIESQASSSIETPLQPQPQKLWKPDWLPSERELRNLSQKDKLWLLTRNEHPDDWVISQGLKREYEAIFGEEIKLTAVSTYLARFFEEGKVERQGSRAQREYRLQVKAETTKPPSGFEGEKEKLRSEFNPILR
ncbi:MAG: hypothetical protein HY929_03000 [Euryarchaeota archaeon]|nr:hypothetical protein [Euryarchaeota archaeon]